MPTATITVLVRLPLFMAADVSKPVGTKIEAGEYTLLSSSTDANKNLWFRVVGGWLVAASEGHSYACLTPPAAAPGDWKAALAADRVVNESLVKIGTQNALSCALPGHTPAQKLAVQTMVSLLGIRENTGPNTGTALSPLLIYPWCKINGIDAGGFAWCAISATYAQHQGKGLGDANDKATWKNYALGSWLGSACSIEQRAISRGLWVPANTVAALAPEKLAGALVVSERAGSGSDAAGAATHAAPGGSYAGHVDLCCGRLPDGTLGCIGGNLSDTARWSTRKTSAIRGIVLL